MKKTKQKIVEKNKKKYYWFYIRYVSYGTWVNVRKYNIFQFEHHTFEYIANLTDYTQMYITATQLCPWWENKTYTIFFHRTLNSKIMLQLFSWHWQIKWWEQWVVWCCRCLPQCLCNSRIPHERVHVGLWDQIRQYQMLRLATAKQWSYPPVKIMKKDKCEVYVHKMQICL